MGCGETSGVVSPQEESQFYKLVAKQVPTQKILLKQFPMTHSHALQLAGMNLTGIRELRLQRCNINHETMQGLSGLDMPILTKLSLNDNEVGPIGCRTLAQSKLMKSLTELSLNNNKIKDVGLNALAETEMPFVEDLNLNDNMISNQSIKSLIGKLPSVECLSLGSNKLDDSAVPTLRQIAPESIYFLKLSRNKITDQGLKHLLEGLKNLDVLLIEKNEVKGAKDQYKKKDMFLFY